MNHFTEQAWIDFARGLGAQETRDELEAHLARGCSHCGPAVGLWKRVYSIASNEPSLTPPDGVVRAVKLQFATVNVPQQTGWTLASMVFDSLRQPLTAGVRSGRTEFRQLLFEAEGTIVDLVVDVHTQNKTLSIMGQVVDKRGARIAPRRVTVISWTETGQPLAETSANEFGEFQLEFAPQERLRLSIEIAGHQPIRIPPIKLSPDEMRPVT